MSKTKKISAIVMSIIRIALCLITLAGCSFNPKTQVQTFNVQGDLKVGIISDSQLTPKEKDDNGEFKQNLINALSGLKANNVNMILFAGDIGDEASNYAYDTYVQCYHTVYGDDFSLVGDSSITYNQDKPLVQTIMGNHDYWGANDGMLTKASYRKRFEKKLGHSPYTHYVVNGYLFIGASPMKG